MKFCVVLLILLFGYVRSHSWIACSDYLEKNGADWDPNKCRGFPRSASTYAQKDKFGLDRGFDHKPGGAGMACKTPYGNDAYSSEYPKAIYFPGQQVILTHPMKNHGASSCTNPYIPDFGNAIYRGRRNRDRYETYDVYKRIKVADLGISPFGQSHSDNYPKLGYQNAPNFCADTDKSMGTYSFNVPRDLAAGEYTFVWRWSFNGPQDRYTTCFDVVIAANKRARDSMLSAQGVNSLMVACGGRTSDNSIGSDRGCDDVNTPPPPPTPPTARPTVRPTVRPTLRPTVGPTRPPRPTRPTVAPTEGNSQRVPINMYQLAGEIALGRPQGGVRKRYVSVHFDCPVQASFWNARLINSHNHEDRKKRHAEVHYDLLQEMPDQVMSGKIYFTATYGDACDIISNPPLATLTMEE